jgi:hypothetical protein
MDAQEQPLGLSRARQPHGRRYVAFPRFSGVRHGTGRTARFPVSAGGRSSRGARQLFALSSITLLVKR